jgi:D-alanine transaminase
VFGARIFRFREHFDRLARSLAEVRIASPHTHAQWLTVLTELVRCNGEGDMYLYIQVTRGTEHRRNHAFPTDVTPTVFAMASPLPSLTSEIREHGLAAITVDDFRWGRCDIKSTMLLANVLMKQQAVEAGAQEAIIVRDGEVLEGSSTSVFVIRKGVIATPMDSHRILPGTTRDAALELAATCSLPVEVRSIRVPELLQADELWISAATRDVLPVTSVDWNRIGNGRPGPLWRQLSEAFLKMRANLAGTPEL